MSGGLLGPYSRRDAEITRRFLELLEQEERERRRDRLIVVSVVLTFAVVVGGFIWTWWSSR